MDRTTSLHETPECFCGLENVSRSSTDTAGSSKWVKFQFCADYPSKPTWQVYLYGSTLTHKYFFSKHRMTSNNTEVYKWLIRMWRPTPSVCHTYRKTCPHKCQPLIIVCSFFAHINYLLLVKDGLKMVWTSDCAGRSYPGGKMRS